MSILRNEFFATSRVFSMMSPAPITLKKTAINKYFGGVRKTLKGKISNKK